MIIAVKKLAKLSAIIACTLNYMKTNLKSEKNEHLELKKSQCSLMNTNLLQ